MLAGLALFATVAVGDLAETPIQPPTEAASVGRISYDGIGNGWTGGRTNWWIDPSGRGGYESTEQGQRVSGRFDTGVEGFRRVRDLLAPLASLDAMPCQSLASDQPVGQLSWQHGARTSSLRVEFGCADSPVDDAWTRFNQAAALVREWATTGR